jgi:hypothetical protein
MGHIVTLQDNGTEPPADDDVAVRMLQTEHGLVVGGPTLWRLLGYRTGDAFRKAAQRKTLPVPVFNLAGRQGRFALTADVAHWIRTCAAPHREQEDAATDK